MKSDLNQQQQRRKSFPPQKDIATIIPTASKSSISTNNISAIENDLNSCPLTEENLAIHTRNFPPSKDARRRNCKIFVESQIPVVAMEMKLQQQREKEISCLEARENIQFVNSFDDPNEPLEEEISRRSKWFNKLKHWIRIDSRTKQSKTRHLSWSAGTEIEDHKMADTTCQKRDSGISIFSNNHSKRRSSPIASIPISRQPKFSPSNDTNNDNLITYQYPKMRRKSSMIHAVPPPAAFTSDDNNNFNNHNNHALEKLKSSPKPAAATTSAAAAVTMDCKGSHCPDQQSLFKSIQHGTLV